MKQILFILLLLYLLNPFPVQADPAGYLIIPKISLYKSFTPIPDEGNFTYDLSALSYGVGQLENTLYRRVFVGHTPGAFNALGELTIGDEIIVVDGENSYSYIIYEMYVTSNQNGAILHYPYGTGNEIALITCRSETERLIVKAR